jgi:hypothetical protein
VAGLDHHWGPQPQNVTIELEHYERILARERELLDQQAALLYEIARLRGEMFRSRRPERLTSRLAA